jgi:uncharacterized protein (TIGR02246 family)
VIVRELLAAMAAHDWTAMGACLADDVVRVGPYGDTYTGRDAYVSFIAALLPTLPDYAMDVQRVTFDTTSSVAVAELSETVTVDGAPLVTPEALVFDLDPASGLIRRIQVFIQQVT